MALAARTGPGTVRELAQRAQVGYGVARYTASRMVSRGELVKVDRLKLATCGRPPGVYALPSLTKDEPGAAVTLQGLLQTWTGGVQRSE